MELGFDVARFRPMELGFTSEVPAMEPGFTSEVPAMEPGFTKRGPARAQFTSNQLHQA